MSNPWWWKRRFMGRKSMQKKIDWKHDGWTLDRIYKRISADKRQAKRARIVLALFHLRAGLSVESITKMLGESRTNLRRHRLLTKLNYKNLIPLYFQGERGEIEAYFPQTKQIFDEIDRNYESFVKKAVDVLAYWQNKEVSRKEVALGIVGKEQREVCSIIFRLLETKLDDVQRDSEVRNIFRNMRAEALIDAWGLKEELVESVVDEIL